MEKNHKGGIAILTSIIGFGVHFPGLLISKQLEESGFTTHIFILERLFTNDSLTIFNKTKQAFQGNFRLAQIAAQLPIAYKNSMDDNKVSKLLLEWLKLDIRYILCLSGLWLDVLQLYKDSGMDTHISCLRIDAGQSKVWADLHKHSSLIQNSFFLFNLEQLRVNYILDIPKLYILPYQVRSERVTIHGGGWGLGTNFDIVQKLSLSNYNCNLLLNYKEESSKYYFQGTRFFMNDPGWNPLNETCFPAFGELVHNKRTKYKDYQHYNGALHLISKCKAIVSKPGGMSLMDSLITETPLIFTEPMGENEMGNKKLWEELVLGIDFARWEDSNFSKEFLEMMHQNLSIMKKTTPTFLREYLLTIT